MARFLLLCIIILAEASILMGKSKGARGLGLMPPMTMRNEEYGTRDFRPMAAPVPSAALAESEQDIGVGEIPGIKQIKWLHKSNKSIAGADIILGGYATAFVAAVFCYIRVTRNRENNA